MTQVEMTPPAQTRMDRRRARTREQILDVAQELFVEGYKNTRMEDLAEAADVSVGSLYTHFGNKEGLMLALAERTMVAFNDELTAAFDPDLSALEQVMAVAERYVRFYIQHREPFRMATFGPEGDEPSEIRVKTNATIRGILDRFEASIAAAIEADEIDSGYSAASLALFLWGAWNGVIALSFRNDELGLNDEQLLECLDTGRRLVNEGMTAPRFRDSEGHSKARLIPPIPETRATGTIA